MEFDLTSGIIGVVVGLLTAGLPLLRQISKMTSTTVDDKIVAALDKLLNKDAPKA